MGDGKTIAQAKNARGPCYRHILTEIMTWINNHIRRFNLTAVEVRASMGYYIPLFYSDVIIYPCHNPFSGLANP